MGLRFITDSEGNRVLDWASTPEYNVDAVTASYAEQEILGLYEHGYDRQYPEKHMASGDILPYKEYEGYEGDQSIEIYQYDSIGIAAVIASHERGGPPVTSVARRVAYSIETQGNSAFYSWMEVRAAQVKRRPLEDRRITDLKKAEENYFDYGGWFGDSDYGLYGLHTLPIQKFRTRMSVLDTTDADTIVDLLNEPLEFLVEGSNLNVRTQGNRTALARAAGTSDRNPKILVLPSKQASRIWKVRAGTDSFAADIWLASAQKRGFVDTIISDNNCRGAGPNGEDVAYLLPRDPEKLCLGMFHPFELVDPQQDGLRWDVRSVFRTSLAMAPDPTSALRIIGI